MTAEYIELCSYSVLIVAMQWLRHILMIVYYSETYTRFQSPSNYPDNNNSYYTLNNNDNLIMPVSRCSASCPFYIIRNWSCHRKTEQYRRICPRC